MSNEPLQHIQATPLPWRERPWTYCGRASSDVAKLIGFDEAKAQWRRLGAQRAAFVMCMTCVNRVNYAPRDFADDPLSVLMACNKDREQVNADLRQFAASISPAALVADELATRRAGKQWPH